jgi:hypothetical protein
MSFIAEKNLIVEDAATTILADPEKIRSITETP